MHVLLIANVTIKILIIINNCGRMMNVILIGGVEVVSGNMFLTPVKSRDAPTLFKTLKKYVRPGTIITVDCWRGYRKVDFASVKPLPWVHQTVNHDKHWVDPSTLFTTNVIEGTHVCMFYA
jgi:hypothetical protein